MGIGEREKLSTQVEMTVGFVSLCANKEEVLAGGLHSVVNNSMHVFCTYRHHVANCLAMTALLPVVTRCRHRCGASASKWASCATEYCLMPDGAVPDDEQVILSIFETKMQ